MTHKGRGWSTKDARDSKSTKLNTAKERQEAWRVSTESETSTRVGVPLGWDGSIGGTYFPMTNANLEIDGSKRTHKACFRQKLLCICKHRV